MHTEIASDTVNVAIAMKPLHTCPEAEHREKAAKLKHDIENCLASIETANCMLDAPDLSPEDRLSLLTLRKQASIELAQLIETDIAV